MNSQQQNEKFYHPATTSQGDHHQSRSSSPPLQDDEGPPPKSSPSSFPTSANTQYSSSHNQRGGYVYDDDLKEGTSVVVSYIVSLLKAGNGVHFLPTGATTTTNEVNSSFCLATTHLDNIEGSPPKEFMPIMASNTTTTTSATDASRHIDPLSQLGPTPAVPPTKSHKGSETNCFIYNPSTVVFPKKAFGSRGELWGLVENSVSSNPLGTYASPPAPSTTNEQHHHSELLSPFANNPEGGLFPNASGLIWTLELLSNTRDLASTQMNSIWSNITRDDLVLGDAFQSEMDHVANLHLCNPNPTTDGDESRRPPPTTPTQHEDRRHKSHDSPYSPTTTPGGQTSTEGCHTSSNTTPFNAQCHSCDEVTFGMGESTVTGGGDASPSAGDLLDTDGRRQSSSVEFLPQASGKDVLHQQRRPRSSATSLEVETLTSTGEWIIDDDDRGEEEGGKNRAPSETATADALIVSRATSPPSPPPHVWSDEMILTPAPYNIDSIDIFEDLVRGMYASTIHHRDPTEARACSSAEVGAAVCLFLKYIHCIGCDCAKEYHRCGSSSGEGTDDASRILLPSSNLTWSQGVHVPNAIQVLRDAGYKLLWSLQAALQLARVFHSSYSIPNIPHNGRLCHYRTHLLHTLSYDVTTVPPHAFIDGLCKSRASKFILETLGKVGVVDNSTSASSASTHHSHPRGPPPTVSHPGVFIRNIRSNIDTSLQHTTLVTSCRHWSWIAAAAIGEALLWSVSVVVYFERFNGTADHEVVMQDAMGQYEFNKVSLLRSIFDECGPAAALYMKRAIDILYFIRMSI